MDAVAGSLPNGEAGRSGSSHACSGTSPTPEEKLIIACSRDSAPLVSPSARSDSARSPDRFGHRCPVPVSVGGHGAPTTVHEVLAWLVAVAVPVGAAGGGGVPVAVVAGPARRGHRDLLVEHGQRCLHVGVGDRKLAEPDQFLEAAVDYGALVHGGTAVAEAVADRRVRVTGL